MTLHAAERLEQLLASHRVALTCGLRPIHVQELGGDLGGLGVGVRGLQTLGQKAHV
jgi:hypothetical protein